MSSIEDDAQVQAYEVSLEYLWLPPTLFSDGAPTEFRYRFEDGELHCSQPPIKNREICVVSRRELNALRTERPRFIYLDIGCWVDDEKADGTMKKHRDFGMVCGSHVYLCRWRGRGEPTASWETTVAERASSVPTVQRLFSALAKQGSDVAVVGHARIPEARETAPSEGEVYLFLGDMHLPPVSWFFGLCQDSAATPPYWIHSLDGMRENPWMRDYWTFAQSQRERGEHSD